MRRFEVWLDKGVPGVSPEVDFVEVDDNATDEEIQDTCAAFLDTMISNSLDTGWREVEATARPDRRPDSAIPKDGER